VAVTEGYFQTMGIPLVEGRGFRRVDPERASDEMVVSRAFAERYWPNGSALGKRVRLNPVGPWQTIVGVVGDVHNETLSKPAEPIVYQQHYTVETDSARTAWSSMALVVRTAGDPMALAQAVRREVWSIDRALPIIGLRTMEEVVRADTARTTFTLLLVAVASGVALLLGAVGIYGVISYMVSLRTREIGVRLALGARPSEVRAMVVRQGLRLTGVGVAVGVVGALALGRFVAAFLYGVAPYDPVTLTSVTLVLAAVSAVASWLPAARAAGIDPVEALRAE
jgi:predicted permease